MQQNLRGRLESLIERSFVTINKNVHHFDCLEYLLMKRV